MVQSLHRIESIEDALFAYSLTRSQLDAVTFVRTAAGEYYFLVKSASQPGVVYKVIYNTARKVLQCCAFDGPVCKASEAGIPCWHRRAAQAHSSLMRMETRQRQEQEARTPEKEAQVADMLRYTDEATARRVVYAKAKRPSAKAIAQDEKRYAGDRTFNLMR